MEKFPPGHPFLFKWSLTPNSLIFNFFLFTRVMAFFCCHVGTLKNWKLMMRCMLIPLVLPGTLWLRSKTVTLTFLQQFHFIFYDGDKKSKTNHSRSLKQCMLKMLIIFRDCGHGSVWDRETFPPSITWRNCRAELREVGKCFPHTLSSSRRPLSFRSAKKSSK